MGMFTTAPLTLVNLVTTQPTGTGPQRESLLAQGFQLAPGTASDELSAMGTRDPPATHRMSCGCNAGNFWNSQMKTL